MSTRTPRYSPRSRRVRANELKSAIAALAWARLRGLDPLDVAAVNEARRELLGLSPIPRIREDEGLGGLLRALVSLGA